MSIEYNVTKSTVELYKFRQPSTGEYWADITIDSNGTTGRISIASDFGNWQNYWGACGKPFKEFLCNLNMEYAADKFKCDGWFDAEATIKLYKQYAEDIVDVENKEKVEAEIKLLIGKGKTDFYNTVWDSCPAIMYLYDQTPPMLNNVEPLFKKFWTNVWVKLVEVLREEIKAGK